MNITSAIKTARSVITANSPVLLVGSAIAGVITTGVLAAKAGYKARGIVDEATAEKGEELTLGEKVSLTWLCYAAPVITGGTTIAACVGVHTIHTKRHAAMAGLYAMATSKMDEYTEKAEEMLGEKKAKTLKEHVATTMVEKSGVEVPHNNVVGSTEIMCYDEHTGRVLPTNLDKIEAAVAKINTIVAEGCEDASLNEFYEFMGWPSLPNGADLGWNTKIESKVTSTVTAEGVPVLSLNFRPAPRQSR